MESELERHCQTLINVINDRDFDFRGLEARKLRAHHISPQWTGRLDNCAFSLSFPEQVGFWQEMTIECPDTHFELVNVDCNVRKHERTADVVMRTKLTRNGVELHFACELKWMFNQGRWMWYSSRGIRGMETPM